jgi:hypothetical protein
LPIDVQAAANSTKQVPMARAPKRKIVGMFFFFLMHFTLYKRINARTYN